ncbi:hypothetical protein ACI77N_10690 [Pseudomonas sp. S191]|uniref:hypothetical protein n=1 Tax=Pseudomonas sp. S191 TaxID=579575 RepID=UPI00387B8421
MARQEIILGMPPQGLGGDPPRTASMKINAMTQELYQGLDATTKGGWGAATPPVMPEGYDANDLTGNRVVAFNEGKNLPVKGTTTGYWFVETLDFGSGYRYQRAASFVVPGATFARQRHSTSGWTAWTKIIEQGDFGLGGDSVYNGNLDALVATAPVGLSQYRCSAATTGSLPPGCVNNAPFDGCTVLVSKYDNNWCRMWLNGGTGGTGGAIGGTFSRVIAAGGQGAWVLEYNAANTLNPVDSSNGRAGLMDDRFIGDWRINRIRTGFMISSAGLPSMILTPNEIRTVNFTLPVNYPDWGRSSVRVTAAPSNSPDWYGITTMTMNGPNTGYFVIRNGGTANTFVELRITITGYWS